MVLHKRIKQARLIGFRNGRPFYSVSGSGGHNVFDLDQASFRGRNDDGSETGATWIAAADTNWTQDVDENFRVRFLVQEIGAGILAGNHTATLSPFQYNLNSAGWNIILNLSSVVKLSLSTHFTNLSDTTQQLGSGTFITGVMYEGSGSFVTSLNGDDETENEGCFQIVEADVSDEDTIQLRCVGEETSGTVFSAYTSIPTITVNKPAGGAPDILFQRKRTNILLRM